MTRKKTRATQAAAPMKLFATRAEATYEVHGNGYPYPWRIEQRYGITYGPLPRSGALATWVVIDRRGREPVELLRGEGYEPTLAQWDSLGLMGRIDGKPVTDEDRRRLGLPVATQPAAEIGRVQ